MSAADKLLKKIIEKGNPVCVGLDPQVEYFPKFLKEEFKEKYGETKKGVAEMIFDFNKRIIDAVFDLVPVVKPNIAFYEKYGSEGVKAFEEIVNYAKSKELLVVEDAKRSDIGNTAAAYAAGHLGEIELFDKKEKGFDVDWLVVNPYLGFDSIEPFLETCQRFKKGIFVLAKTSNPSASQIQNLKVGKEFLYEKVGLLTKKWGSGLLGERGYSSVGMVVGATYPKEAIRLRRINKKAIFLVPGYGMQGAKAKDLKYFFNKDGLGAIVNSSRKIIYVYKFGEKKLEEEDFDVAAREEVERMIKEIKQLVLI